MEVAEAGGRTGVLVVRVWVEGDPPGHMRARLTHTLDVSAPREVVQLRDSAEEVIAAVRVWLDAFLDRARS